MIVINKIILLGRLVRDVDMRFVPSSGMAVAKFTLAVDKGLYGDKKQEAINQGKPTADFLQVSVFGKQAENCANFLSKGSQCLIEGKTVNANYEKDGQTVYKNSIIADKVTFLGSKNDGPAKPQQNNNFNDFPDEDMFQPVDPSEDIPF